MSTSKKTSSKSVKSPAPATKSSAAKPVAPKKVKVAAVAPVAKPAAAPVAKPASKAAPAPAPVAPVKAPQPVAAKPVQTTISARVNVGFGNTLTIRGEGAGLSWDSGLLMDCAEDDLWRVVLPESAHGHIYKFLVNDLTWSIGPDFTAACGSNVTHTPEF